VRRENSTLHPKNFVREICLSRETFFCAIQTCSSLPHLTKHLIHAKSRVFNDLIDDFTKSDFKLFSDNFEIFKIILKYGDLFCDLIFKMSMKIKSQII
jgi:hypothetical protein